MEGTNNNEILIEVKKMINSQELLSKFLNGKTFNLIMDFIVLLQKSVQGKNQYTTPPAEGSSTVCKFTEILTYLDELITQTPPLEDPQRYGNKAFKTWYGKIEEEYDSLMEKILINCSDETKKKALIIELKNYFLDCFGSSKRLDYGTGHELNFLCILLILYLNKLFSDEEIPQVVHFIFFPYLLLVRRLQITYKLEPAGAHGVWGLDEYHFLPFIFGASELIDNTDQISPASIHDDSILEKFSSSYMYLSCIKYIKQVKKANHFGEHSPMLDTISRVPNWEKVSNGLVKMYVDEVLKKLVVMQHFYFGNVLKFE
jgi:serine/threonine-protein phosphatase 2A activator